MRIGTWNLDGRWGSGQRQLLQQQDCDIWLLTEVPTQVDVDGYQPHRTDQLMASRRHWAAILTRAPFKPLPDPHPASAAAQIAGTTYCSSVLPWRSCRADAPWYGGTHAEKMAAALTDLRHHLPGDRPLIWGGDFNQGLLGPETAGSAIGRDHLLATLHHFGLQTPTAGLRHRLPGVATIDHIGVPHPSEVTKVERIPAPTLSDHDAYIVETAT